jgi:hypothetical protein
MAEQTHKKVLWTGDAVNAAVLSEHRNFFNGEGLDIKYCHSDAAPKQLEDEEFPLVVVFFTLDVRLDNNVTYPARRARQFVSLAHRVSPKTQFLIITTGMVAKVDFSQECPATFLHFIWLSSEPEGFSVRSNYEPQGSSVWSDDWVPSRSTANFLQSVAYRIARILEDNLNMEVINTRPHPDIQAHKDANHAPDMPRSSSALRNHDTITVAVSALSTLIDSKLVTLYSSPPNSDEARKEWNDDISEYENLQDKVMELKRAVEAFVSGRGEEESINNTAVSFSEGVKSWWTKCHERICERAYETGIFLSAVTVCGLTGQGGSTTVAVALVLTGAQHAVDALKAIGPDLSKLDHNRAKKD